MFMFAFYELKNSGSAVVSAPCFNWLACQERVALKEQFFRNTTTYALNGTF